MEERVLYFDCGGGVSGDMILGALVDLGLPLKTLVAELGKLPVRGFKLKTTKASRSGIRGTRLTVETRGDKGHRHFSEFSRIIDKSRLSTEVKETSVGLFRRIYEAEARVHGKSLETIHLHELGSLDTVVDVVGTAIGLEALGVSTVISSPINVGGGEVQTEHGLMPVPAPATVLLLKGAPVFSDGSRFERTTPTGALLVTGFARRFGPFPAMTIEKVGHGIGGRDAKEGRPNLLRLVMGKGRALDKKEKRAAHGTTVLETTIDDMTPELAGHVLERLLEAGALDVFITPVQMKKNRPGLNLTVITDQSMRPALTEILFRETTTLGIRSYETAREVLERKRVRVDTPYGKVWVKLGLAEGRVLNAAPEYEDCRRIASAKGVTVKEVQQHSLAAFWNRKGEESQ